MILPLKLLMCGTSVFKFEDFKSHTAINGAGAWLFHGFGLWLVVLHKKRWPGIELIHSYKSSQLFCACLLCLG